ncbi:hypothetical protein PSI23_21125 [Xenorhabdus sp. XENO-10]|uniref:Uncharacterized protein n=1 Tax=Xenorhabdus yunnanensis TaxID=3025878 RepID=A0ABT5LKS2_9GAMM|nr:hypothetical protein [Xenorhabdus yunnanensis]MDC9591713.1 hypothetical protein [Xenorhabdus yunnanensis]
MRHFGYNPCGAQDEQYERRMEEAAYQEAVEEQRENDAHRLYESLPEGTQSIFSPRMNELFGDMFDTGGEADEEIHALLYKLCQLKIQGRAA